MIRRLLLLAVLTGLSWYSVADTDTTATLKGSTNVTSGTVTVVFEPTGLTKTGKIGADGNFSFSFMPIGGPYKVTVSSPGYKDATADNVQLAVYQNSSLRFNLVSKEVMEEVVVTGQRIANAQGFGSGTTLDRQAIDEVPTVNRSIADYAKMDPRVNTNFESSRDLQISAMGANNRFNDFQIDGVSFNDPFGLNANGFGTLRNPISMDFVDQIAVDITPYDVTRGNATGASISVVTKSGSNDFHGSAYYSSRDEKMVGDLPGGKSFAPFNEDIYSLTLSGPIIKDKLFFFVGYEKLKYTEPFNYGPKGSGKANESEAATADVFQQIADIAQNVYGFDPGGFQNLNYPETHEEYIAKIDYQLNNANRFQFDYSQSKDARTEFYGGALNTFANTSYVKPPKITRYSASYYGDLTDQLRVKAKYTSYEMEENDHSTGGNFPDTFITYTDGSNSDDIRLGGDRYRAVNYINVKSDFYTLKFDYDLGAHLLTAGVDYEKSSLANYFLARYNGEIHFDSIADFQSGMWSSLRFNVPTAGLEDTASTAADFEKKKTSLYLQDVWSVNSELTVQYGLRYDQVKTPTLPAANAAFEARYGYTNAQRFDYSVTQPRFSFEYAFPDNIGFMQNPVIKGGIGLFLGRFPNVWLGNAYSRPGPLSDYKSYYSYDPSIGPMPAASAYDGSPRFFWLKSAASSYTISPPGSNDSSQYVDPNFEGPNSWRTNLALDFTVGDGYDVSLEMNYDNVRKAIAYRDPGLVKTGTLADGRGTYSTSGSLELTNTNLGHTTAFTASVKKSFLDDRLNVMAAFTHMNAQDVWDLTSAQAESAYGYQQRWDGDNFGATTSQFDIKYRMMAVVDYSINLIGDNLTRFSLIWNHQSGEPYSVTFDNGYNSITGARGFYGGYDLAYIPTGIDDPNVQFSSPEVAQQVMSYIHGGDLAPYAGGYVPRDALRDPWITHVDFRLTQEINFPNFSNIIGDNKAIIYLDIVNLGNLLDKSSGIIRSHNYNTSKQIITNGTTADGKFIITGVDPTDSYYTQTSAGQSSWQIRLGLKYQF